MGIKKNTTIYSGQPKFFIPVNVSQLFKPRPPFRKKKPKKNEDDFSFSKAPNKTKIYCSKIYLVFTPKKNINLYFEKIFFLFKRSSESYFLDSIFFRNFRLRFFPFKNSKFRNFQPTLFISRFLRNFSRKILSNKNFSKWLYVEKKKFFF